MSAESRVGVEETVLARYDGEEQWVCTDRRLLRGAGAELSLSQLRGVERVGRRDLRYLVAGLASLTLAVLVPTLAVGAGVGFFTVAPLGAVLALGCPVGLFVWFRSTERSYEFRYDAAPGESGGEWRLPDDEGAAAFVATVRERVQY